MANPSEQAALARRIACLKHIPLLADLRDDQLRVLASDFRARTYPAEATIFRQDDRSREVYVVRAGLVRIFKTSPAGEETVIQIFSTNDIVGELAALDHQPRSASAKTIGPCELLEIDGDLLVRRMHDIPELAMAMTRLLACKLRWTADYAETVAQYDAAGRLLHILLLYNAQFGRELESGKKYELDLQLTQSNLAAMIGARREWVNRILQIWHRGELLEFKAGKITLLDLPRVIQLL